MSNSAPTTRAPDVEPHETDHEHQPASDVPVDPRAHLPNRGCSPTSPTNQRSSAAGSSGSTARGPETNDHEPTTSAVTSATNTTVTVTGTSTS